MIQNLGTYAHPPKKRGTITAAKRKGQSAPKSLKGAAKPKGYGAMQMTQRLVGDAPNIRGSKKVTDVGKVSSTPGTNTRQMGTIAPGGPVGTVNSMPSAQPRQLVHQRAVKPQKMKKSGKEKRSPKLAFFGM